MAGLRFRANTAQVATGTSAKTILQLVAASNHRVLIPRISISFEGVTPTDPPIQVVIRKQTDAGTASALTLVKDNDNDDETLQTTAQHTATAEPTGSDSLETRLVHPQGSRDFGPFVLPGGDRIGVVVTASVGIDCVVSALCEE
jgi:hypothetical protein